MKEIRPRLEELNWYVNLKQIYPNFVLDSAFIGKDHKNAESVTITGHLLHPTKKDEKGKPKKLIIDFFLRTSEGNYPEIFDMYFKDWKQIMEAKLNMGRAKDLNDLLFFVPFKKDINKFTNRGFRYFTFAEDSNIKEAKINLSTEANTPATIKRAASKVFKINDYVLTLNPNGSVFFQNGTQVKDKVLINKVNIAQEYADKTLRFSNFNSLNYFVLSNDKVLGAGKTNYGKDIVSTPIVEDKIRAKAILYKKEC